MTCKNNGRCCKEISPDGYYIFEDIIITVVDGKCNYLDEDGNCTIYDKRPQACRDYVCPYCDVE